MVVFKFGGSSISNSEKINFVAGIIRKKLKTFKNILVVVSAPSDITDDLIKLSKNINPKLIPPPSLLQVGEMISISLLEIALKKISISAKSLNHYEIDLTASGSDNNAEIVYVNEKKLFNCFKTYKVIIVPGFIAKGYEQEPKNLGRGGSDYTAVYLAYKLSSPCYLYSDVKGIYTSDPSLIDDVKKLNEISYEELKNIIDLGFPIRQNKAIKFAQSKKLEIYLGSTFHYYETPTHITSKSTNQSIKYIAFKNFNNKTMVYLVANNISKRNDIRKIIKDKFKPLNIKTKRHIISFLLNGNIGRDKMRYIHNTFALR